MKIGELNLSARTFNCLSKAGIITVEELQEKTEEQVRSIKGMSDRKIVEIRMALERTEKQSSRDAVITNITPKAEEPAEVPVIDKYNQNIGVIKNLLIDAAMDFCAVGFYLKEIRDKEQYKEAGYSSIWECAYEEFGLSKSAASRHMKMNDMYSVNGNSTELDKKYISFNKSQLQEMMSLPDSERENVTPSTPVTEIRKLNPNSKASKESVATSQQVPAEEPAETVIEGTYREVVEETPAIKQPELPVLKNMEQREEFLKKYQSWPVWCKNELTEETFYRYELPDGSAVVVKEYPTWLEWRKTDSIQTRYYLVKPGLHHFADAETNMTTLKDHMKEVQKS